MKSKKYKNESNKKNSRINSRIGMNNMRNGT